MRLHYLVKLKSRVFVKIKYSNAGKTKLKKFYLLTLILLEKDTAFWLWHRVVANLIRKACTKLYQNRPRFVKDMTKTFWCVFWFTVLTAVHLQNANAKFYKVDRDTVQVRWKTLTFLYDKFTQDNMYQCYHNLSGFVHCMSKKTFRCVFLVHSVYTCVNKATFLQTFSGSFRLQKF